VNEQLERMKKYLSNIGAAWLPHAGQSYLEHNVGVYYALKSWGCYAEVCDAGFFHSIYGTERFTAFKVPLSGRPTIREMIGARGEALAYLNCTMDRKAFDEFVLSDVPKDAQDRDLMTIHLADWLNQVPLSREWKYRYEAYESIAKQIGGEALSVFRWIYRGR
jgi:hypothetical protein